MMRYLEKEKSGELLNAPTALNIKNHDLPGLHAEQ
jgi:hypothetical protein